MSDELCCGYGRKSEGKLMRSIFQWLKGNTQECRHFIITSDIQQLYFDRWMFPVKNQFELQLYRSVDPTVLTRFCTPTSGRQNWVLGSDILLLAGTQVINLEWRNMIICRKEAKVRGTRDVLADNFSNHPLLLVALSNSRFITIGAKSNFPVSDPHQFYPPWDLGAHIEPFRAERVLRMPPDFINLLLLIPYNRSI